MSCVLPKRKRRSRLVVSTFQVGRSVDRRRALTGTRVPAPRAPRPSIDRQSPFAPRTTEFGSGVRDHRAIVRTCPPPLASLDLAAIISRRRGQKHDVFVCSFLFHSTSAHGLCQSEEAQSAAPPHFATPGRRFSLSRRPKPPPSPRSAASMAGGARPLARCLLALAASGGGGSKSCAG